MSASTDLRLDPRWVSLLAKSRENGMGFHVVDLILKDGRLVESVPVFNLEHALVPDDAGTVDRMSIAEVRLHRQAQNS